ncbi:hypothetical protein CDL12_17701 [Handroanthus impetiginosus]|uniref:Uncharacterized protein n=1 Tax=Handroanthus impetiginosus TaxID=429701 RepID=A0A2G9GWZ0_9LAMI|nr:hypothetical protein CDL12_17701 [Handroanthus impetiginosus]
MQTDLKPFSLMGLPKKMTCEKDLHAVLKCDFLGAEKSVVSVSVLRIKLPSNGGDIQEVDNGGHCTTPTAEDHSKNNVKLLKCPPAPRKPKALPSAKRKSNRVLLDLSDEIESLFPSNFLRGKIKRVRTESAGFKS